MKMIPWWPEAQHQQAAMSTNGRLIVVEGSGHYIHGPPAVVIDAVQQVVEQATAATKPRAILITFRHLTLLDF